MDWSRSWERCHCCAALSMRMPAPYYILCEQDHTLLWSSQCVPDFYINLRVTL